MAQFTTSEQKRHSPKLARAMIMMITELHESLEAGITPDLISYNSAMTACGAASQWQRALVVFESMKAMDDMIGDLG